MGRGQSNDRYIYLTATLTIHVVNELSYKVWSCIKYITHKFYYSKKSRTKSIALYASYNLWNISSRVFNVTQANSMFEQPLLQKKLHNLKTQLYQNNVIQFIKNATLESTISSSMFPVFQLVLVEIYRFCTAKDKIHLFMIT